MHSSIEQYKKGNCLSLVKLIAAFQVMTGHLMAHLDLHSPVAVDIAFSFYNGVPIFFIVSGLLIWFSVGRSVSYGLYIKKRFLRIYPELWGAVVIELISIIVLYNKWNVKDLLKFSFAQGTILQFWTPESLRGYGCGTPNGTLWTVCVMIQFYILSWFIFKLLHNKRLLVWIIVLLSSVGISVFGQIVFERIGIEVITKLYDLSVIRYGWLFGFGCFIAEYKEKIVDKFLAKCWFVFLALAVLPYLTKLDVKAGYNVLHSVLLVSGLIGFAYAFPKLSLKTDISYGIFLYHMIIVNVFITYGWINSWGYAIVVMVITCVLAYISNSTIGTWSAKRKQSLPSIKVSNS